MSLAAANLKADFPIGSHVARLRTLTETIRALPAGRPAQLFLGNPRGGSLKKLGDGELAAAAAAVVQAAEMGARLYAHAPYTINLCRAAGGTDLLCQHLQMAVAIGCRGVVVHVGKSVELAAGEAIANMRANVAIAAQFATAECPLLIETPAGQGTETLTGLEEFIEFVSAAATLDSGISAAATLDSGISAAATLDADQAEAPAAAFGAARIGICVDTCHVFACGHDPVEFVRRASATGLLRLVHFNDSAGDCGSCVDRHASPGTGLIGGARLREVALFCDGRYDMVVE